jgi:hypothetical protein
MVPTALSRCHSTISVASVFLLLTAFSSAGCTPRVPPTVISTATPEGVDPVPGSVVHGHVLDGALHDRTGAYLTVSDAASAVHLRLADMPGLLYRISTPPGGGLAARVTGPSGRVRLGLQANGDLGPHEVTIELNRGVRWDIRMPAGAGEQHLDLRRGRVTRIDMGASGLVDLRLPRPRGTVPITLTDAVGNVRLSAPTGTPVRLDLRAGARRVVMPRRPATTGAGRYTLTARADVGDLTVDW